MNRQLRMGAFAAIDQRIATRFTIKPMDLAESAAYLRHHLKLAGREAPVFADDAIAGLYRVAGGLPRQALRWWRAGYEAGRQAARHEQQAAAARWDQLVASYRAQHAASRQASIDALLLETIDVLARLLTSPGT